MKIVGLTGGIGSGKTLVASFFEELGVPVYIADIEAKKILANSKVVRRKLIKLLGEESFTDGKPNKSFIANKIFNDKELLTSVNGIIHPKVATHFNKWVKKQKGNYCIKEAAILFENGSYKNCDFTILVTAPLSMRIERVMKRDNTSKAEIEARMSNQWEDQKKEKLASFVIQNINKESTKKSVITLHSKLLEL